MEKLGFVKSAPLVGRIGVASNSHQKAMNLFKRDLEVRLEA